MRTETETETERISFARFFPFGRMEEMDRTSTYLCSLGRQVDRQTRSSRYAET